MGLGHEGSTIKVDSGLYGILVPVSQPFPPVPLTFFFLFFFPWLFCSHLSMYRSYPLHPSFVSAPHRYLVQMEAARPRHELDTEPEPECGSSESSF